MEGKRTKDEVLGKAESWAAGPEETPVACAAAALALVEDSADRLLTASVVAVIAPVGVAEPLGMS